MEAGRILAKTSVPQVVFTDANLPDGTEVRVEPLPAKPLSERLSDVIGIVQGGPPDLAENHDHYLYGTPKK